METERPPLDAYWISESKAKPIQNLDAYFDKKSSTLPKRIATPVSRFKLPFFPDIEKRQAIAGPVARGVEAIQEGISLKDIPYVAAKAGSGYLMGIPEIAAENPLSGVPGAMMRIGVGGQEPSVLPEPATEQGRKFGDQAGFVTGFLEGSLPRRAVSGIAKGGEVVGDAVEKAIEVGKRDIPVGIKSGKREFLKRGVASKYKVLTGLERVTNRMAEKEARVLKSGVKEETKRMVSELNKASREDALRAQKELPRYFRKHFDEYEAGLDNLVSQNRSNAPRGEVSRSLESALNELGLRGEHARPPASPTESRLLEIATDFADIRRHKELVPTETLIQISREIKNSLPKGVRSGQQLYGAGEHAASVFKENYGKVLEKYVKGLSDLNSKYSDFFKVKREANKIFKPYAGEFGTKTAEQFLKRSGLPRNSGTVEEAILSKIQTETGVPIGQRAKEIGGKISSISDARRAGLERIKDAKTQRLIELNAKKNKEAVKIGETIAEAARKAYRFGSGKIF